MMKEEHFRKNKTQENMKEYYFLSRSGCKLYMANVGQVVKRACKDLDISPNKVYPHNFRHTFSVNMLKNTKGMYLVSKLLEHCNVTITEEYLKWLTKLDIIDMDKGYSILDNLYQIKKKCW